MSSIESMKVSYGALSYSERVAFLSGIKSILEIEMHRVGEDYDQTDSKAVRFQLLEETQKLQTAIYAVKDASKEFRKDPSVVEDGFWDILEQYLCHTGD